MPANKHGLSRSIPAEVKRAVRQRSGFGCVSCGASVYEYEHFDPEFAEAKEHAPSGITLLCPSCHALKTKGILTNERIRELNSAPAARASGHSKIALPHFKGIPSVQLGGGALIRETPIPLQIYDQPAIQFLPPEDGSDVTRISALIRGAEGEDVLRIIDNEWIVEGGVWDFEWVGQRMSIRNAATTRVLELLISPPSHITISRMITNIGNHRISISESDFEIDGVTAQYCGVTGFHVGVQVGERTPWCTAAQGGVGIMIL